MTQQQTQEYLRAVRLLPPNLRQSAIDMPGFVMEKAEEFRLRAGKPATALVMGKEIEISREHPVNPSELQMVLEIATRASAHSYAESISSGYVTAEGGCRLGLCGSAITQNGKLTGLRRMSSICIRIPREKRSCGDGVFSKLTDGGFSSCLIISPPGGGKTTLLRELIRRLSDGGMRISLADERGEVAGIFEGQPCFDVGTKTDVLSGAPKAEGIMLLLRAMAPQLIAFDEITAAEDVEAAKLAANCGVMLLSTAHAKSLEDLSKRSLYKSLLSNGIFQKAVVIENRWGVRKYTVEDLE